MEHLLVLQYVPLVLDTKSPRMGRFDPSDKFSVKDQNTAEMEIPWEFM